MSRPISESVSLLNETLTNCKTNLKDKGVEADTIKISDVDEKIIEIQAGGGSTGEAFNWIENVTLDNNPLTGSLYYFTVDMGNRPTFNGTFKFTPKDDGVRLNTILNNQNMTLEPSADLNSDSTLIKGTEYTLTVNSETNPFVICFYKTTSHNNMTPADIFAYAKL